MFWFDQLRFVHYLAQDPWPKEMLPSNNAVLQECQNTQVKALK